MYVGLENYIRGIKQTQLIQAFGWSLFITILSVAVIILMLLHVCMVYLPREDKIYKDHFTMLCLFAMIVPFQMEMFTLSKIANMLAYGKSVGTGCDLPWIWCRTFRLYVYRVHEIHSIGD